MCGRERKVATYISPCNSSVRRQLQQAAFTQKSIAASSAAFHCRFKESTAVSESTEQSTVHVALGDRSYDIVIASGRIPFFALSLAKWLETRSWLAKTPGKAFIITDSNVADPHAAGVIDSLSASGWSGELIELQPGEQSKSLAVISGMYDHLVESKADRQTLVVAVGGGVVGDAAGFAAATYTRGLTFVQVPTSLLAQVDSSVGGKVGVNHAEGKNLIGAFHQPLGVFIDTSTLDTLPDRDYRSGLAEVVKYGVILDARFFEYLETHVDEINTRAPAVLRELIARSCQLKADVVEQDEQERTGQRAVLNYGHTFAHAFEALMGYGELQHGEAVAIGMVYASRLAERRGLIDESATRRQIELLEALGLPTELPDSARLDSDEVLDRMMLDKKTVAGQLRFVLPTTLGRVEVFKDVPESDVRAVLDE